MGFELSTGHRHRLNLGLIVYGRARCTHLSDERRGLQQATELDEMLSEYLGAQRA